MGFYSHKSGIKFHIKRRAGVVANESAEGCIRSNGATSTKPVAEKASPADSLTRSCEPFVDGTPA